MVAVVIAAATLVERGWGTDVAREMVYGSWWFVALWGVVAASGMGLIVWRRMWRRPALLLLHVGFVVILAGALVTRLTGCSGFMHLRVKDAAQTFWVRQSGEALYKGRQLPFMLCLSDFEVTYDEGTTTPRDYISHVVIAEHDAKRETTISMNNIARVDGYRIYQTSFDDDLRGSVFTISYDPWGTPITYAGYALLALGMMASVRKTPSSPSGFPSPLGGSTAPGDKDYSDLAEGNSLLRAVGGPSAPPKGGWEGRWGCRVRWSAVWAWFIGVLLASYMVVAIAIKPLVPVLRSPLLFVHVGVIMISYVLLVVSIVRRSVLRVAVYFLAAGIFLGAIWASVSWGTYWSWDPKEAWALVTLIVYSLPLHERSLPWFRSTVHYRCYILFALAVLLMTYFGVNFLLGGMHSYTN